MKEILKFSKKKTPHNKTQHSKFTILNLRVDCIKLRNKNKRVFIHI